jgi:hypothetical protein
MRCISVPPVSFLAMMVALGNDVQGWVVGDNKLCYILLPDETLQQTKNVLLQRGYVTTELSDKEHDKLMGNTPMNLRHAIQMGALQPPSDTHRHLWEQVCAKAGIVEESYAKTMFKALQYAFALSLRRLDVI